MEDLSLHILDLVVNSIHANASHVLISIEQRSQDDLLKLVVEDDGQGMDEGTLQRALEPGFTTKESGKGGMGLPLLLQAARQTQGDLLVDAVAGWGTRVTATFHTAHQNALPLGNMVETMAALLSGYPDVDVIYRHRKDKKILLYSTAQARWHAVHEPRPGFAALIWTRADLAQRLADL